MEKIDIKDLSKEELANALAGMGQPQYRARQIRRWLYKRYARSFDEMTDLAEEFRQRLQAKFHIVNLALLDHKSSALDRTAKYLFKLEDGNTLESVLIPEGRRNTICLSSQVGCKFGCSFCASAPFGFIRNLKASEIIDQVVSIKRKNASLAITNIVLMGIGEPLDNYDSVLNAIRTMNDKDSFNIGARKITISTCGLVPGMERLKEEGIQVELSVSLHSAHDRIRSRLVPINKVYPLKALIKACRDYTDKTGRIITFEYVLLKGMNSSGPDAVRLAKLLGGMKCKLNTIAYNQVRAIGYEPPGRHDIERFVGILKKHRISVTHRKSRGEDIDAGCGQLRISRL